jgi:hypothetical protein
MNRESDERALSGARPAFSSVERTAGRLREFQTAGPFFLNPKESKMIPSLVKKPPPRLGDIPGPADLARRTDRMDSIEMRLGRIEGKIDALIDLTSFLGSPAMRQVIGAAIQSRAMLSTR